ncbi:MAG: DUF4412 domain-containing protein [Gemmatimonadetes bacterium]|nr:DUF4412 domain-containing protein [Gemmatimonadota bacterium]
MSAVRTSTLAAAALALVLAARSASAQSLFEGQITMTMTTQRGSMPVELYLKDGVSRMDMTGPGGQMSMSIVNDPNKKEMLMIMPERQMYMRRSTDMSAMQMPDGQQPPKPTFAKTGKKEKIAGIECEWWTIETAAGDKDDACIASGIGTFAPGGGGGMMGRGMGGGGGGGGRGGPGGPQPMGWSRGLEKGMFPLKVTKNGETIMEVTKVEKKKVDPALFQAPDGFQEMPGMGGGRGRPPAE